MTKPGRALPPALKKTLQLAVPIALGVLAVLLLKARRPDPIEAPLEERVTSVRVLVAQPTPVVPRMLAYGTVEPGKRWSAVAQVAGRVVEKHETLRSGSILAAGTVLLRIDPREFELAVQQARASLDTLAADLSRLDAQEENTQATLAIERRSLVNYEKELERLRGLLVDGTVSDSDVDREETNTMKQRVRVQDLENSLRLIPVERTSLEARMRSEQARWDTARLNLDHTTITAPFACRIVTESAERTQFVSVGQTLAEAHGIDVAEIRAQVPLGRFRALLAADVPPPLVSEMVTEELLARLGLTATVRLRLGDRDATWQAKVVRMAATLETKTRTMGVIVAVERPYEKVLPGERPPLLPEMFCEVEIRGPAKPDRFLIPRSSLHGHEVFLERDGRMVRQEVEVDFSVGDFSCVSSGIGAGDRVILSDLVPAIDGMRTDGTVDPLLGERLAQVASGEAELR